MRGYARVLSAVARDTPAAHEIDSQRGMFSPPPACLRSPVVVETSLRGARLLLSRKKVSVIHAFSLLPPHACCVPGSAPFSPSPLG